jgi:glucokinase
MRALFADARGPVAGAVVGVPGPIDYSSGEVLRLSNLPGWEGPISAGHLTEEFGLPVLLANDADLAALGEHRYGAGRGSSDMLYLTCSTGVGAGVILDGRLVHGRLSLAEVGHTIIDRSSHETVERLGSGTALARLAGEDAASVAARARAGDADARRHFAAVAEDFAIGVFNLVHCYSPQIVVIGGGMSQAGDLLLEPIRAMLGQCSAGCPASRASVVRAEGGDDVGLRGAAAYWTVRQGR